MADRTYPWRFRDRWWHLLTAVLGFVMGYTGSFIEGNNADLMVASPTQGDDGLGLWTVLLVCGAVLVVAAS